MSGLQLIRGNQAKYLKSKVRPGFATIGNFDGLHLGHQWIIEKVVQHAKARRLVPTLITFDPPPILFFDSDTLPMRLTNLRQKLSLLQGWGIQQVVILRFNAQLANLRAEEFIETYLVNTLQVEGLVVGEDFRFGYQKEGNIEVLQSAGKQFNFTVLPMALYPQQMIAPKISSTRIRQALLQGDFSSAKAMLGRPYSIIGKVVKGAKRGRLLGFPTANVPLSPENRVLAGVYVTHIKIGKDNYSAVANVGWRPSIQEKPQFLVEVHLLDFNGDLYGKRITVEFLHKIRDEIRFASIDQLREQITQDVQVARNVLQHFAEDKVML